jgi:hypothetical protein
LWPVVLGIAGYVRQMFHHLFTWYTVLCDKDRWILPTHKFLYRKYCDMTPESLNSEVGANVHYQPTAGWTHSQALQE